MTSPIFSKGILIHGIPDVCSEVLPSLASAPQLDSYMTDSDSVETFGSHVGLHSSPSVSPVSHFNAELTHGAAGWVMQEQPSGSALRLCARQEVAGPAACNSTSLFVWVTYIMALFIFYCSTFSRFS